MSNVNRKPNRLLNESSPYLQQHAYNPVDWYPWGEEALDHARKNDLPILVSIGYSSCHWCHVMERESFEDADTAALMNRHFVNIKIDREERPDLDHIYMDAVQAMKGGGGWPLNVFLTPDGKPFYGGTYFPPVKAFNRSSWKEVLEAVSRAYRDKRGEVDKQADQLTKHLEQSSSFGMNGSPSKGLFSWQQVNEAVTNLLATADTEWGGFGQAPKFPQTFSILFLLRFSAIPSGEKDPALVERAREQALLSLDKMINGGIYDQVGGGFSRYSTDRQWLVPHFEKMLYDNALLLETFSEAFQLTGRERYREVIRETIQFLEREMKHSAGGYYAALDADSEGVEGKFYVWTEAEIDELLGGRSANFKKVYDITPGGNFEHSNIPWLQKELENYAEELQIPVDELKKELEVSRQQLLKAREKRVRPGLDDKVLIGWNALLNTALSKAYSATGENEYLRLAKENMKFLLNSFEKEGTWFHTWKEGKCSQPAFLDDLAYLVQALINLQECSGDTSYLEKAKTIMDQVFAEFREDQTGFFFYTAKGQKDVIVRKKEVYDGAQPSGNAVMMENMLRLSRYLDKPDWLSQARETISSLGVAIVKYPGSFAVWARLVLQETAGVNEILVMGPGCEKLLTGILRGYIPNKIIMCSSGERQDFPLFRGKKIAGKPLLFLCRDYACQKPVETIDALLEMVGANPLKVS